MLRNYFKVALRNMSKHKGYSLTNIAGLAVGMACCVLIMLWVKSELSFDRFHDSSDNIFRVYHHLVLGGADRESASAAAPMGPAMVEQIPQVLSAVRLSFAPRTSVTFGERQFFEEDFFYADNSILEMFTFPMTSGDPASALTAPYSVVLTEELSRKYFGAADPVGQVLRFDDQYDFTITGVMSNPPANSHMQFDMLCSFETLYAQDTLPLQHWGQLGIPTYLLLADGADPSHVEAQAAGLVDTHLGETLKRVGATLEFHLQPLNDIHLYSEFPGDAAVVGSMAYVYLFSAIAAFILLIACINFVNLATARSAGRAREIGMRKAFGAARSRLVGQFLGESLLYSLFATILAAVLVVVSLPWFNSLAGQELVIGAAQAAWLVPSLAGLAILVGLVAGSYPALFLSSFQPVRVLKGIFNAGAANSRFRRVLVVIQFSVTVVLIIGTVTIFGQIDFMKNNRLGFDQERVVMIANPDDDRLSLGALKNELATVPGVISIAAASNVPGSGYGMTNYQPEGFAENEQELLANIHVDHDFVPTMAMEMAMGRNFAADMTTDISSACLINEAAARRFDWEQPVGKIIRRRDITPEGPQWVDVTVVGVVRDFHLESLRDEIQPLYIDNRTNAFQFLAVRIAPGDVSQIIGRLEDKFRQMAPNLAFDFFFLDESFNQQYQAEEQLSKIALAFCMLAVFIGCLGLLGLSSYTAEQRTKEIGIRKVLGASVGGIVRLLSQEFLLLVVLANVIGAPIAYYSMERWLSGFAYRIEIDWTIFTASGVLALLIALMAVSLQAVRAAIADPVKAIKYE